MLAVRRGSRAKRQALRQITDRLRQRPEQADLLIPLLRISLRSVRVAERRQALAVTGRAAFDSPSVRGAVHRHFPELQLFDEGAAG